MNNWLNKYADDIAKAQNGWQQQQERVRQEKLANLKKINPNIVEELKAETAQRRNTQLSEKKAIAKDATNVKNNFATKSKPLTKEQIEQQRIAEIKARQGEITQHIPQSTFSKVKEIGLNPMTAIGYAAKNQRIPDNFSKGERNPFDYAVDILNPVQYVEDTKNVVQGAYNLDAGQFTEGALGIIPLGLEAKNIVKFAKNIPQSTGQFVNNLANPLAGTGDLVNNLGNKYLPNAHKYNPFAKGNALNKWDKNSFLRQVDDETYKEGVENGLIKGKQNINVPEGEDNINKAFGDDAYYNKGRTYYKNTKNYPYLYEVNKGEEAFIPKVNGRTKKYNVNNTNVRVSKEPIPLNEATVYQKDWLKGYKQVEVPKTAQNFKSEIDWGKWNKEIPDNPQLMKEYNVIEQTSKANGSWMKNPDGSEFKGSPEKFVQQNSENFKKAFPDFYKPDGNYTPLYHGTEVDFEKIDPLFFGKTDDGWYGKGFYTTPDEMSAKVYAGGIKKGFDNVIVKDIYSNSKNTLKDIPRDYKYYFGREKITKEQDLLNWKDSFKKNSGKNPTREEEARYLTQKYENPYNLPTNIEGYGDPKILKQVEGSDLQEVGTPDKLQEVVIKFNNPIKSAKNNNGMFDMTNPNIYKSIAPIAGASYLATQTENKQQEEPPQYKKGGIIKDNNGYWNPNNWGKPVEINSNRITMKGVNEPLLGVSDEGDVQMMYPEEEYKFIGNKVTEYPLALNGININKQSGGWLDKYN